MARLHDVRRGIPHEEFVRRKRRERRLDRSLSLLRIVPWPRWAGVALLLVTVLLAAPGGWLATGAIRDAWTLPALMAGFLVVAAMCFAAADLWRARTPAGRDRLRAAAWSYRELSGPNAALSIVIGAAVVAAILFGLLLTGGTARDALGGILVVLPLVTGGCGVAIVYGQLRARVLPPPSRR